MTAPAAPDPNQYLQYIHAAAGKTVGNLEVAALHMNAVLALVFEQRTANLLRFLDHTDGDQYGPVRAQAMARLGLTDTEPK